MTTRGATTSRSISLRERVYALAESLACVHESYSRPTCIYCVQEGLNGPVKIGHTNDLTVRLRVMQSGNPRPLRVIAFADGLPRRLETEIHHLLVADRIGTGEWFDLSDDVREVIDAIYSLGHGEAPLDA